MSHQHIPNDIHISKTLSWLLRHGAIKEKIPINSEGFVNVNHLLNSKCLQGKCDINDIIRIVETNNKKRFALRKTADDTLEIKAVQGHSLQVVNSLDLIPITKSNEIKNIIHGTYYKFWDGIKLKGLSRMNRNHIHFASGIPQDKSVISGMRKTCQIYIYINVNSALLSGIKFYKSSNDVILSPGDENGFIQTKHFLKVLDAHSGRILDFEK